jgi:hypothetical protein
MEAGGVSYGRDCARLGAEKKVAQRRRRNKDQVVSVFLCVLCASASGLETAGYRGDGRSGKNARWMAA